MNNINYLNVNANIRIKRADDRNLEVEHKRIVKSHPNAHQKTYKETERWVFGGYFPNVYSALNKIIDEKSSFSISEGEATDIKQLIDVIKSAKSEVIEAVKQVGITLDDFDKKQDGRGRKKSSVTVAKIKDESISTSKSSVESVVTVS